MHYNIWLVYHDDICKKDWFVQYYIGEVYTVQWQNIISVKQEGIKWGLNHLGTIQGTILKHFLLPFI